MSTILELCQSAADELSTIRPSSVGPTALDPTAQKLFRHLTRTCRQLAARYDWQILRREKTFTTSGVALQSGAIPSDFLRFVKGTMFNRTRRTRVLGPLTPAEWQNIQATVYTSVYDQFIQRGNAVLLTGTLAAGQTIAFEYISKNIGLATDGTTERSAFTDDADTTYFDDELVISGTVWRYLKAEGRDYSEEYREHELRFADLTKMDGGRRRLDMNGTNEDASNICPPIGGSSNLEDLTTV